MIEPHEHKGPAGSEAVQAAGIPDAKDTPGQNQIANEDPAIYEPQIDAADEPSSSSSGESSSPETLTEKNNEKAGAELHEQKLPLESVAQDAREYDEISPVDRTDSVEDWPNEKIDHVPSSKESDTVPVVLSFKKNRWGRYSPLPEQKLRNNLSGAVGYLEFANALDFAANVWNTIPVPTFAAALMGVGGSIAIILSFFAMRDGVKAWRNVRLLRSERAHLKGVVRDEEKAGHLIDGHDLDVKIEVNRRELGQEIVDRFAMDVFMGFSSLVVGIGTLLAIDGANPRSYHASNLLSGYIGNSPSAFWGLGNTLWSAFLFRRARRHYLLGTRDLKNEAVKWRLKRRTTSVRIHSFVMGVATLVSAPAGLVTATMWQGYPPLIPCIILAKWGNVIWRRRLGYTRFPISAASPSVNPDDLIRELEWTISMQVKLQDDKKSKRKSDAEAYRDARDSVTSFMNKCGLLEYFCMELLQTGLIEHKGEELIRVDQTALELYEEKVPTYAQIASLILQRKGQRALAYRERYLLELLGASVYDAAMRKRQAIPRKASTRG